MKFHIARLEDLEKEKGPEYQARMEVQWGRKSQKEDDFRVGRNGDHIICPFECDLCVFRKLRGVDPSPTSHLDKVTLAYIRRMNLDAMWSWASATVFSNRDNAKKVIDCCAFFGLEGPFLHEGPHPDYDHVG